MSRISPNEVSAIGDGPNDIEMLRHVGTGVAMGNACDRAKAAADFVTGHHENDGLAEFIERYLLKSYATRVIYKKMTGFIHTCHFLIAIFI
ncbi:HAD hydrolase family protein [Cytobacillus oceanisediminis]|uniref:HAD family hydrolase n=1 Tax=Cytobacillus oceanisediminis TaxID=665099 RepID=UPI0023DA9C5B|nr:HAD hydrolase family protein [Cytobacillus oceanisediminis]MDF2036264.1 HAD hydrolase family protein [Cytobacillus oceanisediminis]